MYKKIILKITLLLSSASVYAAQKAHRFARVARTFCTVQRARLSPLIQAIHHENNLAVQALLEQGNQDLFALHPDTGYSLAHAAIRNNNKSLLKLLYKHGARLLPEEQTICYPWKKEYPRFFEPINPDFAPECVIS
ncbi:MAG: hypothetical protein ACJAZS_000409 [Alteromonas naphthalenivorans]|jgi:hypothetical protein